MIRLVRVSLLALLVALGAASPAWAEGGSHGRGRPSVAGVVNLNQANEDALELLPGIGPAKAKRIVEWRGRHPFKKIEDLVKVKGIGKKTMAKLKPYLTVSGPTTLSEDATGDPGAGKEAANTK